MPEILQISNPEVDSLLLNQENWKERSFTIIHCSYYSSEMYINGGWVTLWKSTFLENIITNEQLPLVMAIGIPMAPKKHYFKRSGEHFPFTLVFAKLPSTWKIFSLKEYPAKSSMGFAALNICVNDSGIYRVNIK